MKKLKKMSKEEIVRTYSFDVLEEVERLEKEGVELEPIWHNEEYGFFYGWFMPIDAKVDGPIHAFQDGKVLLWLPAVPPVREVKK